MDRRRDQRTSGKRTIGWLLLRKIWTALMSRSAGERTKSFGLVFTGENLQLPCSRNAANEPWFFFGLGAGRGQRLTLPLSFRNRLGNFRRRKGRNSLSPGSRKGEHKEERYEKPRSTENQQQRFHFRHLSICAGGNLRVLSHGNGLPSKQYPRAGGADSPVAVRPERNGCD